MYEPLPSPRQSHSQNDPKTLPRPRPSLSAASTVAPAEISCSTTAAWPFWAARCSGVSPRAPRMRRGRRAAAAAVEKQGLAMGCFSRWVGKIRNSIISDIGHKYQICQADIFASFSVRHGEKQEEQSSQICSCSMVLLKSYKQLHLTFAASCVTCPKNISWMTLDYPSADKPYSQVKK